MFERLIAVSTNSDSLEIFIEDEIKQIYDFFISQPYSLLRNYESDIKKYIFQHRKAIWGLNIERENNYAFVTILLELCEKFGFQAHFKRIFDFLTKVGVSKRMEAAAFYLIGIRQIGDYHKRLDSFLYNLNEAYEQEQESEENLISTIINFYSHLVHNFGQFNNSGIQELKNKLIDKTDEYFFLSNAVIEKVFSVDTSEYSSAFIRINEILDEFLEHDTIVYDFDSTIESDTEYAELLSQEIPQFSNIRNVSVNLYTPIQSDLVYRSLGHGVNILEEEIQLLGYMYYYGKMHYAKLNSSYQLLDQDFFDNKIDLYDWGCGQALASFTYLDFLNSKRIENNVSKILLIDPSEIATKRGTLHIKRYSESQSVTVINKGLDSLSNNDFSNSQKVKLHIFSNILDIDHFSMERLVDLIKSSFSGLNYFIIVSPYISQLKRTRIDSFVRSFASIGSFELIDSLNKHRGEWINSWTIVRRIFSVEL